MAFLMSSRERTSKYFTVPEKDVIFDKEFIADGLDGQDGWIVGWIDG